MATLALKYDLTCSICLDFYTCPVILDCGHNFCRVCIQQLIEQQAENGYCPECRRTCSPENLHRVNFKLGSIAEYYKSIQGSYSSSELPCTFCIQSPSTAVKTCLHCEASFCRPHLHVHCKSQEHVLVDPTTSLQNRKCRIHNEVLKYFCIEDKSCICASCCLIGEHQGHLFELLEKASLKKKEELKKVQENLKLEQEVLEKRTNVLHDTLSQEKGKVVKLRKDLEAIYSKFYDHIVDAHVNVLNEVGRHLGQVSKHISLDILSIEKRTAKLSEDLEHVQTACSNMDPLTLLQDEVCSAIYDRKFSAQPDTDNKPASLAQRMDMFLISLISQKHIEGILDHLPLLLSSKLACLKYHFSFLLNEASASNYLALSADLKTVTYSKEKLFREPNPDRFKTSQVLSISSFSSGKYFWEVHTSKTGVKAIGVAYPTIERSGLNAFLGYNDKSWCLIWGNDHIEVCHNSDCKQIVSYDPNMCTVGVFLDYEAGLLSFYKTCTHIQHLHTIKATFLEPLHAAFYVVDSWMKINPPKKQWK
ncbi:E3 ubiquitin/ISG15 ligase TRIM25-like [Hyla sarda]|uniref:E3 ubiquitin/ISG15 ligase TRIM25-like n=1 Tax=Hyla sarda TaxID=327740 RepID=UPI0024C31656|nr:E3 ubiquitin/ISG15 ligase TRIM25-like [Hyla sarda]XP_056389165.1 E3 ubiquitin/ISG15 ligase TRIM25-like [Hyla sarda]